MWEGRGLLAATGSCLLGCRGAAGCGVGRVCARGVCVGGGRGRPEGGGLWLWIITYPELLVWRSSGTFWHHFLSLRSPRHSPTPVTVMAVCEMTAGRGGLCWLQGRSNHTPFAPSRPQSLPAAVRSCSHISSSPSSTLRHHNPPIKHPIHRIYYCSKMARAVAVLLLLGALCSGE